MGDGEVEKFWVGHDTRTAAGGAAPGSVESGEAIAAEAGHDGGV
ncbi:transketolase [Roseovarius sp. 217]|nr:transketolase [Roseovarius sp. 217]